MLKLTLLVFFSFLSSTIFAQVDLERTDISDIRFDVVKSFDVLDPSNGYSHNIKPPGKNDSKSVKVQIVGKSKWAYHIKLEVDGVSKPKIYHVTKKYLKSALDLSTAYNLISLNSTIRTVGDPLNDPCDNQTSSIHGSDVFEDPEPIVVSGSTWKPGCEVLSDRAVLDPESSEHKAKLSQCAKSIQNSITRRGSITGRGEIFRNMYKNLRPEEQHFMAMIFTAEGEAGILVQDINNRSIKHPEEMMMVMKVINNRVKNINSDREKRSQDADMNALDVVLDPWQFSMYNANEDNWKRMVQPGRNQNFDTAISAYLKFNTADFKPKPDVDHVYHYHANYMLPPDRAWGDGFRANHKDWEISVTVDDKHLRQANPMYDEGSASDRRAISRGGWKFHRHRFYKPIDTDGRIVAGDDWHWTVKRPFRS